MDHMAPPPMPGGQHPMETTPNLGDPNAMAAAMHSPFAPFQGLDATPKMHSPFNNQQNAFPGMSDGASPMSTDAHRLSFSSTAPYPRQLQPLSVDGSDHASPNSVLGALSGNGGSNPALISQESIVSEGGEEGGKNRDGTKKEKDAEGTPSWAELKTKAGKDRKRLPLACIACRRKKIRCSGEKPACKHCLRSRIPCVYKVTTRKAAPRTDYMAMLDKRLKRMEERVIKIMPKSDHRNLDVIGRAVVKPAQPGPAKSENKKRAAQDAFGSELDHWVNARTSVKGSSAAADADGLRKDDLMIDGADKLPSPELQQHLAEVFFDYVYGQSYALLHKPSYMRKLEGKQLPPVLVLSVCAIAARFSTHPELRTEPVFLRGEQWAKPAREIALKRYDTPNITILICYLILGLHEFGTCQGGRSWMLGGMAQRMAYALQLHKDIDGAPVSKEQEQNGELSFTDREIRRRTMWACFMMDRFNSSGTDRPMFVAETYIEAQLPLKEQFFQMETTGLTQNLDGSTSRAVEPDSGEIIDPKENMGVFSYMVKVVSLWGNVVRYINLGGREKDPEPMSSPKSEFAKLRVNMAEYLKTLPEELLYTEENVRAHATENIANQFIFLHIVINQVILFMNRFALPVSGQRPQFTKNVPQDFLNEAARTALEAAGKISSLVNEALNYRVVAPFAGYSAFLSSTVHIAGLSSKNPAIEASSKQYLAWNVKYLSRMKRYWGMFHFVTEHLKDLYRRQVDAGIRAQQGTATPGGAKAQEGIFQYGDWFDRYPHGVSGTDYEDSGNEVKKESGADALFGQKPDLQSVEEFFSKMSTPSKQNQSRKQAKKKQSKAALSGEQPQDANVDQKPAVTPGQTAIPPNTQQPHQLQIPNVDASLFSASATYPSNQPFSPASRQPYSAGAIPNELLLQQQQQRFAAMQQNPGIMSQLDRHMVLSSYAGMNGNSGNPLHAIDPFNFSTDLNMGGQGGQFGFDPNGGSGSMTGIRGGGMPDSGMGGGGQRSGTGDVWNDANSLSWFMPFNVDPPNALGDDAGLFGGGYDFSGAGFGGQFGQDGMGLEGIGDAAGQGREGEQQG